MAVLRFGFLAAFLKALRSRFRPGRNVSIGCLDMPCTCVQYFYPAPPDAESRRLVSSAAASYVGARPIALPCGQCHSCRRSAAGEWAIRTFHESQMHSENYFLTPTFSAEHVPRDGSIRKRHIQLFNKRLRNAGKRFRFFACGEYGGRSSRPHYHILSFGLELDDLRLFSYGRGGAPIFHSALIEKAWPYGHCGIQILTPGACSYVCGYAVKKYTGDVGLSKRLRFEVNPETGEYREWHVEPEFTLMSRRPGIGSTWFDKYAGDAFPRDYIVIDGKKRAVPSYYKDKLIALDQLRVLSKRRAKGRERLASLSEFDRSDKRMRDLHAFGLNEAGRIAVRDEGF